MSASGHEGGSLESFITFSGGNIVVTLGSGLRIRNDTTLRSGWLRCWIWPVQLDVVDKTWLFQEAPSRELALGCGVDIRGGGNTVDWVTIVNALSNVT